MAFLGERGAFPLSDQVFTDNHGSAAIYGYRLLIHPENKNPRLLSYALAHQITGGDPVYINPKFGKPFHERSNAKLMVLANCPPDMDIYNMHESSRMLYFYVNADAEGADRSHLVKTGTGVQLRGDTGFEKRLIAEMPAFLRKCMDDYLVLCPTNGNIVLPETVVHDISDRCASLEQERFESIFDEYFERDVKCWVDSKTIKDLFDSVVPGQKGDIKYASFTKFLEAKGHRKIRPHQGDKRLRGFRYLKPRGTAGLLLSDYELHKNHVGIDGKEDAQ
jgi:hypothetical protein